MRPHQGASQSSSSLILEPITSVLSTFSGSGEDLVMLRLTGLHPKILSPGA